MHFTLSFSVPFPTRSVLVTKMMRSIPSLFLNFLLVALHIYLMTIFAARPRIFQSHIVTHPIHESFAAQAPGINRPEHHGWRRVVELGAARHWQALSMGVSSLCYGPHLPSHDLPLIHPHLRLQHHQASQERLNAPTALLTMKHDTIAGKSPC